jgi:transcription initiation factor TFIIIB Brf1 subunit/transcription initiation factor TFIIB
VRRGNIKDEVLAGLIYFECIRASIVRKKKDIALFMKLPTNGFSRGEDILRNLQAEGKIDIPVDEEPIEGFVDRYLEELNLDNPNYIKFIVELVDESERRKIGMNSQLSSKAVGALWIIITQCGLNISSQ